MATSPSPSRGPVALIAAAGTRDLDLAAFAELMRTDRLPTHDDLRAGDDDAFIRLL